MCIRLLCSRSSWFFAFVLALSVPSFGAAEDDAEEDDVVAAAPGVDAGDAPGAFVETSGPWEIGARHGSDCVEIAGAAADNGARAQTARCGGPSPSHQRWYLEAVGSNRFHIRNAKSGKCLAVPGGSPASGARVVQLGCQGAGSTGDQWEPRFWKKLGGHDFYRLVNVRSGKCLNVQGGLGADGTDLIQASCPGAGVSDTFTWWPAN